MLNFKNKKEIFEYITNKFQKESDILLIRGSSAYNSIKNFSDIDIEIYSKKLQKPYYEIVSFKEKPILISAYFNRYISGKVVKKPNNIKILHGKFNNKIKPDFKRDTYTDKQKIKRECQLVTDFFFKYLRTKDKTYLNAIQKRIK
ncbi:hypothetical protein CL617_04700 [archaeon]|nr:hypothetical protein [archaeon]|tara:strand:- start:333 stop:767 length:435 start_codon:yes stop_codon:yes gene_type:complete